MKHLVRILLAATVLFSVSTQTMAGGLIQVILSPGLVVLPQIYRMRLLMLGHISFKNYLTAIIHQQLFRMV